jgi:hypothetical protein
VSAKPEHAVDALDIVLFKQVQLSSQSEQHCSAADEPASQLAAFTGQPYQQFHSSTCRLIVAMKIKMLQVPGPGNAADLPLSST